MVRNLFLELINKARENKRNFLFEIETKRIIKEIGIPVPNTLYFKEINEINKNLVKINYPCVVKIVSRDAIHKSKIGGVLIGIKNKDELIESFNKIKEKAEKLKIKFEGVIVEEEIEKGLEVIVGVNFDKVFGHVLMFGYGGKFVEEIKDVSFRIIPVNRKEIIKMINETKIGKIIFKNYDSNSVIDLLIKISSLIEENSEILELDLNPTFVYENGIKVIDARLRFK